MQFIYSALAFIVAIGVLISVHEFGHFWVAKRLGIKVLRFSIGFGKPLFSWYDKLGTQYVIAAIPLGGYVKMLDQNEGYVAENERHLAFNNRSVWVRMLIIIAGPLFNLLFAILAYWLMFCIGVATVAPILGDIPKGSVAYIAGLRSGQEIIEVAKQPTHSWEDVAVSIVGHIGDSNFINIKVQDQQTKQVSTHALNLTNWSIENNDENVIKNLGLEPLDPVAPVVGSVVADLPAAKAGLEPEDRIMLLNGEKVDSRSELMKMLSDKSEKVVHLVVKRDNKLIDFFVTPVKKQLDGGAITGFIGIQFAEQPWPENLIRLQRYGVWSGLKQATNRTVEYTVLTLQFLRKMVMGHMSLQNVAGPISIAKFAGRTAASGPEYFFGFLALVSISLGVLNLLPIPVLDGGNLLFCLIELVRGKPLSTRVLGVCNMFGVVILGSFMLLAIYNDVLKIMH